MSELNEDNYKVKGSKDLWECVEGLEAIAHWMRDSSFDYEPRDLKSCLLYTSPSPRDATLSRMPSSA